MTARPKALLAVGTVIGALAISGCGEDKKEGPQIPRADAAALINRLEEAQRRSDPFRCRDLQKDTIPALERQLASLPDNVDADVRSTVEDGIAHLSQLVDEECANQQETPANTTETPTTPPETTPPETTPPETTPPETTPAPTTPAPETPAPEAPGGAGTPTPGGNGNGGASQGQ